MVAARASIDQPGGNAAVHAVRGESRQEQRDRSPINKQRAQVGGGWY